MQQRGIVAYVDGEIVPEHKARISIFDRGFLLADAVYDTERTFGGRIFRLEEHVDRLLDSCAYLGLEPGLSKGELVEITHRVVDANLPLLGPDEDYWVSQRVTRGVERRGFESKPTVIVECTHLPLRERARYYRDGLSLVTPSVRRVPPWAVSPRAKTHNYLNMVLANLEVQARDPEAWALLLDENSNLAEGLGSNVFLVRDGELVTPQERYVLAGISRRTVIELGRELGVQCREVDIDLYDAATADEAFVTSTSFCICPVSSVNGRPVGDGRIPGPLTRRLLDAYSEVVGLDIVQQYLAHL